MNNANKLAENMEPFSAELTARLKALLGDQAMAYQEECKKRGIAQPDLPQGQKAPTEFGRQPES